MSISLKNDAGTFSTNLNQSNPTANVNIALPTTSGTMAKVEDKLVLGTAQTASGTSVNFTGIPSWAKRITVMFDGVSTNGTSAPVLRLGSGTIQTTGYLGSTLSSLTTGVHGTQWSTSAVLSDISAATMVRGGTITISLLSGNTYTISGCIGNSETSRNASLGGSVALSGTLDRIRITTVNSTDTFDAGTINIMWE